MHDRPRRGGRLLALCLVVSLFGCGDPPPLEPPAHDAEAEPAPAAPTAERTPRDPSWSDGEAAFHTMMDALTSPRCVNCHPSDGVPKQTDFRRAHQFGVERGPANHGVDGLACGTCHQEANNDDSGVPGAGEWSLAPASMAWEGLDRVAIARSMMNPENNGERTPAETHHHLTQHGLVLWAWAPGVNADGVPREPPPVPLDEYRAAVDAWFAAGAPLPGGETLIAEGEYDAHDGRPHGGEADDGYGSPEDDEGEEVETTE